MKFTIKDFRKRYPNDDVCLEKLFQIKYSNLSNCLKCGETTTFHRVQVTSRIKQEKRKCYSCAKCGYQMYPCAGTVFEKTRTPLTLWFYAIYLYTTTRNGVAAKELERQLGVTYKCAWRMAHQIRLLMANSQQKEQLQGIVQIDETYVGGLLHNKSNKERRKIKAEKKSISGGMGKVPVVGLLEQGGRVYLKVVEDSELNQKGLQPMIKEVVRKDSIIVTDYFGAYQGLSKSFKLHYTVNHSGNEYVRDGFHTNTIEGFWSQLKRTIKGTHIMVSKKHLEKYANEVAFRYQHRHVPAIMFELILSQL